MSECYGVDFAPQGWQCPICKRVYSPTTPMCYYCGNGVTYTTTSTTVGDTVIDLLHRDFEEERYYGREKSVRGDGKL